VRRAREDVRVLAREVVIDELREVRVGRRDRRVVEGGFWRRIVYRLDHRVRKRDQIVVTRLGGRLRNDVDEHARDDQRGGGAVREDRRGGGRFGRGRWRRRRCVGDHDVGHTSGSHRTVPTARRCRADECGVVRETLVVPSLKHRPPIWGSWVSRKRPVLCAGSHGVRRRLTSA